MTAINSYLTEGRHPAGYPTWSYTFPNGHTASVIPDPHLPFHFEVVSSDPADANRGAVASGLTTEQVLAKLRALADLPKVEVSA